MGILTSAGPAQAPAGGVPTAYQSWEFEAQVDLPDTVNIPDACYILWIRFEFLGVGLTAPEVIMYLADDIGGQAGLTPDTTTGATQTMTSTGPGTGFVAYSLNLPFKNRSGLFVLMKLVSGTYTFARPTIRVCTP